MENTNERRNQGCAYSPKFTFIKTNVANSIEKLSMITYVLYLSNSICSFVFLGIVWVWGAFTSRKGPNCVRSIFLYLNFRCKVHLDNLTLPNREIIRPSLTVSGLNLFKPNVDLKRKEMCWLINNTHDYTPVNCHLKEHGQNPRFLVFAEKYLLSMNWPTRCNMIARS